jgi:hypothetical protein
MPPFGVCYNTTRSAESNNRRPTNHTQADGGELAAAICAATAALADAGIELRDLLPACCVVRSSF